MTGVEGGHTHAGDIRQLLYPDRLGEVPANERHRARDAMRAAVGYAEFANVSAVPT